MKEWPTWGWLATRFELALGAACLALPLVAPASRVMRLSEPSILGVPLNDAFVVAGYLGMVVGMLWMIRIAGRGPEDGRPSIWRSRDQ